MLLTQVRLSWLNILSTGTVSHQKLALCFISLSKIQKTYLKPKAIQRMPECLPLKWDWHPSMHMDLFRFLEFRSCLVLCMRVDKASYTLYSNHRKRFKKTKCLYYRALPKVWIGQRDASAGKEAWPQGNSLSSMTWKERADPGTLSCDLQLYVVTFSHPSNQRKWIF